MKLNESPYISKARHEIPKPAVNNCKKQEIPGKNITLGFF
ncbi:hypothetical protein HOLDEFILI_00851 [Holdemania filiformis DSM 12042]|uniref:Uncharacterized protein n=1 Tax=Holdemania filiformis DSM 12042 TaxID=545696 RepID=B9Y4X0_9FIRM|nr:hypothetical protein HOLDEFILI_00851 [Holdemania filiformis DSM 12042]